ncbi:hypothetical protein BDW75DRAFT_237394 [Aspergillus navahoensis]
MEDRKLKVIIIGGSIAGLTLAHCLDLAEIDYLVLEKHHDILATVGGSIGLLPNGSRILDQLGIFSLVENVACPVEVAHMTFGYPPSILTRQQLLQVLYSSLRDQARVRTGQDVTRLEPCPDGVLVSTEAGVEYRGDVVVGADGIHSVTRSQMWRIADNLRPGLVSQQEKQTLRAEYSCIIGISSPVEGIRPGEQLIACHDNACVFVFPGKDNQIGWALIRKLDREYVYPNPIRFSADEVSTMGQAAAQLTLRGPVTFRDLWENTPKYSSTMLEEGHLRTWNYGRIVCVGDSVSKASQVPSSVLGVSDMTPNMAQGANTAIEGAAALANALRKLSYTPHTVEHAFDTLFRGYAERQQERLRFVHAVSRSVTRVHTRRGWVKRLLGRYVYPYTPGAAVHTFGRIIAEATHLDYVPLPERGKGWDRGSDKSSLSRLVWVIPVVVAAYIAFHFA